MSNELPRAPLLQRTVWLGDEDVNVSITSPLGRRISMTVSEAALAQFGAEVVKQAVKRMGAELPHLYAAEIQRAVDQLLFDKGWLVPIIENEVRRATRDFVLSLWNDEEKKNLRDWFDVFTAKCSDANPAAGRGAP